MRGTGDEPFAAVDDVVRARCREPSGSRYWWHRMRRHPVRSCRTPNGFLPPGAPKPARLLRSRRAVLQRDHVGYVRRLAIEDLRRPEELPHDLGERGAFEIEDGCPARHQRVRASPDSTLAARLCCRSGMKGAASLWSATCASQARWRGSTSHRRRLAASLATAPNASTVRNPCRLPRLWRELSEYRHKLQILFRYIDITRDSVWIFGEWQRFLPQALRRSPRKTQRDGSSRSILCDDAGARARRAGGVPQRQRSLSNADLAVHTGLSRPTVSRPDPYVGATGRFLKRNAKDAELGLGILAAVIRGCWRSKSGSSHAP